MGDHASHGKHKILIIKTLLQREGGEGVRLRLPVEIRRPGIHQAAPTLEEITVDSGVDGRDPQQLSCDVLLKHGERTS